MRPMSSLADMLRNQSRVAPIEIRKEIRKFRLLAAAQRCYE
jgi:hypothetical protein